MGAIEFEIDEKNKMVYAILPAPTIEADVKDADSLEYLPEDAKAQIKDVLTICKEDAANEIDHDFIQERATEGLKETVELLTNPLIEGKYKLVFK